MSSTEIIWAAGLFEGEGCCTLSETGRHTKRKYMSLSLAMHARDKDVLERFALAVGVGNVAGPHSNGMCRWSVTGTKAVTLARTAAFVQQLGNRRIMRILDCLSEVESQPAPNSQPRRAYPSGRVRGVRRTDQECEQTRAAA